jgi:8-amino-7-oxononanoate synthase
MYSDKEKIMGKMDLFQKCIDYNRVEESIKRGLYPYFHTIQSGQGPVVEMDGQRTIMIGSNNYLGLTSHPEVIEAAVAAVKKYGSGCSGSRFLNGTLDIHVKLEEEIADFIGAEACVTFSTGFQSNLGVISAIAGRSDVIISDKENHASIYDACRLSFAKFERFEHNDMADLEEKLKNSPEKKGILIVTDGVFSMSGEVCNLPEIVRLAKKYNARVMVDDAHGFGVLGKTGKGTAEHFGLEKDVDIIMGTFSKSLASIGGYMVASKKVVNFVRHTSRPFIFSASITPASVQSTRKALEIIRREPERIQRLRDNSDYVRAGLIKRGIDFIPGETPIISIYTYDEEKTLIACKLLLEKGVYVNPVLTPAVPAGCSLLRTSYTATHTYEVLDEAMDKIKEVLDLIGVEKPAGHE